MQSTTLRRNRVLKTTPQNMVWVQSSYKMAKASWFCFTDSHRRLKELRSNRKRTVGNYLWCEEVLPLNLRPTCDGDRRPQTADFYRKQASLESTQATATCQPLIPT
ncbi:hypothetical protein PoB_007489600 [Plakobranchus ocellatus]|uniref:Uncharacterized protein n=1 Tax=Plakobranchus ocellatus TaxID=259542 RepID=A0AAV4DX27_9GAST|nr:hypothetical protein PoB_007489600 [Plakobranchus ocellatus]